MPEIQLSIDEDGNRHYTPSQAAELMRGREQRPFIPIPAVEDEIDDEDDFDSVNAEAMKKLAMVERRRQDSRKKGPPKAAQETAQQPRQQQIEEPEVAIQDPSPDTAVLLYEMDPKGTLLPAIRVVYERFTTTSGEQFCRVLVETVKGRAALGEPQWSESWSTGPVPAAPPIEL